MRKVYAENKKLKVKTDQLRLQHQDEIAKVFYLLP